MKNLMQKLFKQGGRALRLAAVTVLAAAGLTMAPRANGQATTLVANRVYPLFTSQLLTNAQSLPAAGALQTNALYANVAASNNTLMSFTGSHPIGLTCTIVNSNNFAGVSNVTIYVYPAYDTNGPTQGLNIRSGTNFSCTPLLVWTIGTKTNIIQSTNLPAAVWEPAMSLGYTITNGSSSNLVVTLTASEAP